MENYDIDLNGYNKQGNNTLNTINLNSINNRDYYKEDLKG